METVNAYYIHFKISTLLLFHTVCGLRVVPLGGKDCDHDLEEGVKVRVPSFNK